MEGLHTKNKQLRKNRTDQEKKIWVNYVVTV